SLNIGCMSLKKFFNKVAINGFTSIKTPVAACRFEATQTAPAHSFLCISSRLNESIQRRWEHPFTDALNPWRNHSSLSTLHIARTLLVEPRSEPFPFRPVVQDNNGARRVSCSMISISRDTNKRQSPMSSLEVS